MDANALISTIERNALRVKRTHERRDYVDHIKAQPCMDCGGTFPPVSMDLDHVRGTKRFRIALATNSSKCSLRDFKEEIAKCDVVCANCHRVRTYNRSH